MSSMQGMILYAALVAAAVIATEQAVSYSGVKPMIPYVSTPVGGFALYAVEVAIALRLAQYALSSMRGGM